MSIVVNYSEGTRTINRELKPMTCVKIVQQLVLNFRAQHLSNTIRNEMIYPRL